MKLVSALIGATVLLASPAHAVEWFVTCDKKQTDEFGDKAGGQYCVLTVANYGGPSLIGLSYTLLDSNILIVDEKGVRPYPAYSDPLCGNKPKRLAVDNKRIDTLSHKEQVRAILAGNVYVREEQAQWPKCNFLSRATYLNGISAAYKRLMAQWGK